MKRCSWILAALMFPAAVSAQIYKCEGADGKLTYQQTPCPVGERETRPTIMKGPTLTEEERFNAAAYAEGVSPEEARRILDGQSSGQVELQSSPVSSTPAVDHQAQRQREADCNKRYDDLAAKARDTFRSSKAQGNLQRHLEQVESGRSSCLYGNVATVQHPSDNREQQVGMCQGRCASEQGICFSGCEGNGPCLGYCAASHGRCIAACVQ